MPTVSFTNQKASQALRGQNVIVTIDSIYQANLTSLSPGQSCSISGVAVYGIVSSVDNYGISFEVSPLKPNLDFASPLLPGYLDVNETIIVTI